MNKLLLSSLFVVLFVGLTACGGGSNRTSTSTTSSSSSSSFLSVSSGSSNVSTTESSSSTSSSSNSSSVASDSCASGTYSENVVCAVNAFEATLTSGQLANAKYTTSANSTSQLNVYKTRWSNFPVSFLSAGRAGIAYSNLTTTSQTDAFHAVAKAALTDAGYEEFVAVLAADDYLATKQSGYGANLAQIAIVGEPSATAQWTLMLGNHHMAYVITFKDGAAYPTPRHIAVEPKASFTVDGKSYQALANKASSMVGVFYGQNNSLNSTQLSSARLSATYGDILIGPVEYNTGSYSIVAAKFPTGSSGRGLLVSSLSAEQQAMVTAAIKQWLDDFDATLSADLIGAYTSSTAYSDTYIAWSAASGTAYPNVDINNTYMRIDGPRVWIEIACQGGIVIQGQTHYHMIFRDKTTDYYNELSTH